KQIEIPGTPGRRQLEHSAAITGPPIGGCAIKIARLVEDQPSPRMIAVGAVLKVIDDTLGPAGACRDEFKNQSCRLAAAVLRGGAVQVANLIKDDATVGIFSVSPVRETVKNVFCPHAAR